MIRTVMTFFVSGCLVALTFTTLGLIVTIGFDRIKLGPADMMVSFGVTTLLAIAMPAFVLGGSLAVLADARHPANRVRFAAGAAGAGFLGAAAHRVLAFSDQAVPWLLPRIVSVFDSPVLPPRHSRDGILGLDSTYIFEFVAVLLGASLALILYQTPGRIWRLVSLAELGLVSLAAVLAHWLALALWPAGAGLAIFVVKAGECRAPAWQRVCVHSAALASAAYVFLARRDFEPGTLTFAR